MIDIYGEALETMPAEDIAHHCSDLYLRVTPASTALIEKYDFRQNVTTFIDQIDRVLWYEVPFAYYGPGWRG